MFHPGETVTHNFVIPFERTSISKIIVSYKQNDHVILERTITSAMLDPENVNENTLVPIQDPAKTKFRIQLSQRESLLFKDVSDFKIQINVFTTSGSRHASAEIKGSSGVQHHREVMSDG